MNEKYNARKRWTAEDLLAIFESTRSHAAKLSRLPDMAKSPGRWWVKRCFLEENGF